MTKISARMISFLLIAAVLLLCSGTFFCQTPATSANIVGAQSSDTVHFFAEQQPLPCLSESDGKSQLMRLHSSEMRTLGARKNNTQSVLLKGQAVTGHGYAPVGWSACITTPRMGYISELAVSLGSNAPPVYHV